MWQFNDLRFTMQGVIALLGHPVVHKIDFWLKLTAYLRRCDRLSAEN